MTEPPVIAVLKKLGLSQRDIAQALHVRDSTVSQWVSGKREMAPGVKEDLHELASLVREQVQRGGDPQDALRDWQPTALVTEGGRIDQVVHTGRYPVPPDLQAALKAVHGDFKAEEDISLQAALRAVAEYLREDLTPLTAVELKELRRVLKGALMALDGMFWARAEDLYPPKPGED